MMQGMILCARVDLVEYIRFVGVIRYSQCVGLEAHIDQLFNLPDFSEIAIDLEHAEMLDSTALGLLARISIEFTKISNKKPVIFLQKGELAHILKRVCFDQVFHIIDKTNHSKNLDFVEITPITKNEDEVRACVVEAHRSLAEISEDNKRYFTDITKALG
jgi:anti-anti-sigma regulatory factor